MAITKCGECGGQVSTKAATCPNCGAKVRRRMGTLGRLIGGFLAISVIYIILNPTHTSSSTSTTNKSPKEAALDAVKIKDMRWTTGGFGTIMLLSLTLQNDGERPIKDVQLTCKHSSNSGTQIDRNQKVIFEKIEPGKSFKLKDFSMGFIHSQATSTGCAVTDLVVL